MVVIIGVLVGLTLGLTGSGGSILALPLLVLVLDLSVGEAVPISLGVVSSSAMLGVLGNLKNRNIQWLPAVVYLVIGSIATPFGVFLSKHLSDDFVLMGFVGLVLYVAITMWSRAVNDPEGVKVIRAGIYEHEKVDALCRMNSYKPFELGLSCILGVSGGAITTGILSGLFGVGGGFIIVPTLIILLGVDLKQAVATSLAIIFPVSLFGFLSHYLSSTEIDFSILGQIILGGAFGVAIGLFFGKKISGPSLQKIFVGFMLLAAVSMVLRTIAVI